MSTTHHSKLGGVVTYYENTNFSTAKQKFSFAKGDRFPRARKPMSDKLQYELPSTFNRRAPSFGYGDRFDTYRKNDSPSPDSYRAQSDFEGNNIMSNSKAFTFGICREAYSKVYIPSQKISSDISLPGPGKYEIQTSIGQDAKKISLQGRTPYHNDSILLNIKRNVPGPGHYEPKLGIDKLGYYTLSTIQNSKAANFSPRTSGRFIDEVKPSRFIPGPGQYDPKDYQDGTYTLSKFKNIGVRRFGTAARQLSLKNTTNVPGPGSYRPPSDFGYLDSIKQSPRTQNSERSEHNKSVQQQYHQSSRQIVQDTQRFRSETPGAMPHEKLNKTIL